MNKINKLWGISLMVIGISTFIIVLMHMFGVELSDAFRRILGGLELVCLLIFSFASAKKAMYKKNGENK